MGRTLHYTITKDDCQPFTEAEYDRVSPGNIHASAGLALLASTNYTNGEEAILDRANRMPECGPRSMRLTRHRNGAPNAKGAKKQGAGCSMHHHYWKRVATARLYKIVCSKRFLSERPTRHRNGATKEKSYRNIAQITKLFGGWTSRSWGRRRRSSEPCTGGAVGRPAISE